jgi:hypothetical protein
VTKIPPEHTAARALEESFRRLGDERVRARRRRPRWSLSRPVVAAVASLLVVAGVATGTKVFIGDGGAVHPDTGGLHDPAEQHDLTPSDRQLAQARAADPGGAEPWGLRTYQSAGDETCVIVGRIVGGRLGLIRAGQFKELATGSGGVCGALEIAHFVLSLRAYEPTEAARRWALYGIVDRTVTRLHVLSVTGKSTPLEIAPDGTFLVVTDTVNPFHLAHLVVDGATGRRVQPLGR